MFTAKFNVRVSVDTQARVFNVAVNTLCYSRCYDDVVKLATAFAPKYCTVVVNKGFKSHRGKAINLLQLMSKLKSLHFYRTVEKEREIVEYVPLSTFYEKPFSCEYEDYLGATFFHNINERIIHNPAVAIAEVTRNIPSPVFLAKSGNYYVWDHLSMQVINAPRRMYELCKIVTKTIKEKVQEEYK